MKNITLTLQDLADIVGYSANTYKSEEASFRVEVILERVLDEHGVDMEEWVDTILITVKQLVLEKAKKEEGYHSRRS